MASIRDFSVYCIPNNTLPQNVIDICSGISMATSIVGFVGAALQLKSLWQYHNRQRRRPSANPRIIFYLALSDLFSCIGIFGLAVVVFIHPPNTDVQDKHIRAYLVIAFLVENLTIFAFLASYIWTFTYALDMCLQIYRIECPIIVYHILSWLVPWGIVLSVAVVGNIDRGDYTCEHHDRRITRLILSYIVVMVVICGNPFLFVVTYKKIKHFLRTSGSFTDDDRKALNLFKRKFFWIVFVFTLCWVPNIISVSFEFATMPGKPNNSHLGTKTFYVFLGLEAFLNPLQGVFNFFVYRNAFSVTANETRTNLSPSVPRTYSVLARSNHDVVQRIHQDCVPHSTQDCHNVPQESSQNIADLSTAHVEESPRVGSHLFTRRADASPNTYVCRLLGE